MKTIIQNLINAHRSDRKRIEFERSQESIKVSKAGSMMAVLYESVRNSIDLEEEHLLRKRAVKRILLRMTALKGGNPLELSNNVVREIILARYLTNYPVPHSKIEIVASIIQKYQVLINQYLKIKGKKIDKKYADHLYSLCGFEIDRVLVPYNHKDALVNSMYYFVKDKNFYDLGKISERDRNIITYIEVHRALQKSDNEIVMFHLFFNKFSNWSKPNLEYINYVVMDLEKVLDNFENLLHFKTTKKIQKELLRQSIPFHILDKVIVKNLNNAEEIIEDQSLLTQEINAITNKEYSENKQKLRTAIVRSVIYLFITKVLLAFVIEVPYEIYVHGHLNFLTLGINIFFPIITMFIVANSFKIPNEKNTELIQSMIKAILSEDTQDDKEYFRSFERKNNALIMIFKFIYFILFVLIIGGIFGILYLLQFNPAGMLIFIIFFSTIIFFAVRLRNTATELKVVNTNPSFFSPVIDMIAAPLLYLGKQLSEGASQLNFFTVIFDFLIEAPFKTIIRVFEDWNNFIRETREEIV